MIFNIFYQYNNSFVYLCKSHSFLLITKNMQRQIKASSSPFKLIVSIITLVFTAHITLTSLARSRHFSTFSSSLALTLPSSGLVTIILSQLSSLCRCSPTTGSSPHFHDLFTHLSPTRVCIFIFKQTFWHMVIPLFTSFKLTFS